jgi:hypothetical protein
MATENNQELEARFANPGRGCGGNLTTQFGVRHIASAKTTEPPGPPKN